MPKKPARVVIVTVNILPGASTTILNKGEWLLLRKCVTENLVFSRDQLSNKLPIGRGDLWPGDFGQVSFTNNDPTRTEQLEVWVGEGDVPRISGNGGLSMTENGSATGLVVASSPITVGAGVTMQVVSARNNQRGFWVFTAGGGSLRFAGTLADVNQGGAFINNNALQYFPGTYDFWVANPNGGAQTVYITIAKGV